MMHRKHVAFVSLAHALALGACGSSSGDTVTTRSGVKATAIVNKTSSNSAGEKTNTTTSPATAAVITNTQPLVISKTLTHCEMAHDGVGVPSTVVPGGALTKRFGDMRYFEGPTWNPFLHTLFFTAKASDNQQILQLKSDNQVVVWLDHANQPNGTFYTASGRLITTEVTTKKVMSYAFGNNVLKDPQVLTDDAALLYPNDLREHANGSIYFTDSDYSGAAKGAVYRIDTTKTLSKVVTDLATPNGLEISPDGKTLYVSDDAYGAGKKSWHFYPIAADGTVGTGKVLFDPTSTSMVDPDGMTVDKEGTLYVTGRGGIWAVCPDGTSLGMIPTTEFCSNLTFGGADGTTLYVTCDKALYSLPMTVTGAKSAY